MQGLGLFLDDCECVCVCEREIEREKRDLNSETIFSFVENSNLKESSFSRNTFVKGK